MLILLTFLISLAGFVIATAAVAKYGKPMNRRSITGYEIARQILDSQGYGHITINLIPGINPAQLADVRKFYLEEAVGKGRTLFDMARAGRDTVFMMRLENASVSFGLLRWLWKVLYAFMVMAWIFLILSFCRESWIVLRWWAAGIFVTGFVAAVLELPVLWEVCRETKNFLWQSHYFEVDEQIQLKKLLNRLRWSRLGVIWVAPLFFLRRLGRPSSD